MSSFFVELSLVMLIAVIVSFICHKAKQPLLIGYILTGVLAGPLFFDILSSSQGYETFSHIGIAFLLFIVGLHLNLKLIKEMGSTALIAGIGQITLTTILGFFLGKLFGFSSFISFLIGVGLSFSSTIIIVKLLSDSREIEKVHGKLAMGILIMQDLVAVIMLLILASISNGGDTNLTYNLIKTFFTGIVALFGVLIFSKYVLEKLLDYIASSQEFLFSFVIAWCLGVASLFAYLGFSVEVGALLAGVALASSPYQYEISSRVKPLRDFFIILFFILLGSQMVPVSQVPSILGYSGQNFLGMINVFIHNIWEKISYIVNIFSEIFLPAIFFSLFVIILKPILVFVLLNLMGFHEKVNFLTGISLAQISEFSLIMILIAQRSGIVTSEVVSMLTLVIIITILVSTYLIMRGNRLYKIFEKYLKCFEIRKRTQSEKEKEIKNDLDVLIFGYNRIGFSLHKTITKLDKKYLVVDYDPNVIKRLNLKGIPCVYGDASDNDFVDDFHLESLNLVISTIPDLDENMCIIKEIKKRNKTAVIILTANQIDHALELYKEGADYVILPHFLGGDFISSMIEKHNDNFDRFLDEKVKHIRELKERKEHGFDHPKHSS